MRKALVIEDVPDLASFVVAVLEYLAFEAVAVETLANAVEILSADEEFEAVFISTSEESRINDYEGAKMISAQWPAIKIFVCSERTDHLRDFPPCVFIAKPPNPKVLIAIIERALRARRRDD